MARITAARRRLAAWSGQELPPLKSEPPEAPGARPLQLGNDLASRIVRARRRFVREQAWREPDGKELDSGSGGGSGGAQ